MLSAMIAAQIATTGTITGLQLPGPRIKHERQETKPFGDDGVL